MMIHSISGLELVLTGRMYTRQHTHSLKTCAHIRETSSMFCKTLHPELKQTRGEMEGGKRAMDERQNISQPVGD